MSREMLTNRKKKWDLRKPEVKEKTVQKKNNKNLSRKPERKPFFKLMLASYKAVKASNFLNQNLINPIAVCRISIWWIIAGWQTSNSYKLKALNVKMELSMMILPFGSTVKFLFRILKVADGTLLNAKKSISSGKWLKTWRSLRNTRGKFP